MTVSRKARLQARPGLRANGSGADFARLWRSHTVSAAGSALSAGALPLIAIVVLHAGPLQVSLLAVIGSMASAIITLPVGNLVDRTDRRAVMVVSDLLQFLAIASVPVAALLGGLTFTHLCLVAVLQTSGAIAHGSASLAYVRHTVEPDRRTLANARLETVNWVTQSAGPPVGGALIGLAGPMITLVADALSYLASAVLLRRITPAAPAPRTAPEGGWSRRELFAGWVFIMRHPGLRVLYVNAMVFGGAIMWSVPITAVLMLEDMKASPVEYGIALGVPCVGGLLGATLSPRLAAVLGERRSLVVFGAARTIWLIPLAFVGSGPSAVAVITLVEFLLLLCAGVFNPIFSTYRMDHTPDHVMARVGTAWSVSAKSVQPLFIALGGALATAMSARGSLLLAGILCVASAAFLPWRGATGVRQKRAAR
ncbi:MFS transporter [Streptosporangium carneum]|uniref:MFS transporter n=1 Tax=Streptosporangium carneum TaxID=47481 RepID=A0A9W6MCQ2_9ACTN|nr:MFS transporter [Streptosporangium carneum]GLK09267.1 MFS transporter [Streptosporangium carneum]